MLLSTHHLRLGTTVAERSENDVLIITHDVTLIDLSRHQIPERATHIFLFLIPFFLADTNCSINSLLVLYWYSK